MKRTHLLSLALGVSIANAAAAQGLSDPNLVLINEIRIDQSSTDNDEYFEILTFPGNATLDGLTYLVIGDGSTIESVTDLTGSASSGAGLFLAAESSFTLGTADLTTSLNFENGDNVTHIVVEGFTGANGDDLDTDDDGVLDSTPWTSVWDAIGIVNDDMGGDPLYGVTLGGVNVGPNGSFAPAQVFRCLTSLTDVRIGEFGSFIADTPGSFNGTCTGDTDVFCDPAEMNSTGMAGAIALTGSGSVQFNDNVLEATNVPETFGVFVQADMQMAAMPASIGGNICLTGTVQRMNRIVPIMGGVGSLPLDFTDAMNVENGTGAGDTMYYQFFFRDTTFAGGGNYTDGVAVTWAP